MPTARGWREYPQRYRYEAAVCKKCNKWHFPPRLICDECKGQEFETKAMKRSGKILTYTTIRVPPAPFKDQAPYLVAVVEMDDGPRLTMMVTDYRDKELKIGQRVKLEFRRLSDDGDAGTINYGYKAVPV
ncbi:MAG: transcriptional regulator [Deltaproteobacteria bacterium RIFOXYA12_FULL_58_15]|nr:MAG: transcriptional regulator [Deltaproteobacteria bacterium RIFOXYA12_FULL_58_15]